MVSRDAEPECLPALLPCGASGVPRARARKLGHSGLSFSSVGVLLATTFTSEKQNPVRSYVIGPLLVRRTREGGCNGTLLPRATVGLVQLLVTPLPRPLARLWE